MNATRNMIIDFRVNGKHDHYINDTKHTQPHIHKKDKATKGYKRKRG